MSLAADIPKGARSTTRQQGQQKWHFGAACTNVRQGPVLCDDFSSALIVRSKRQSFCSEVSVLDGCAGCAFHILFVHFCTIVLNNPPAVPRGRVEVLSASSQNNAPLKYRRPKSNQCCLAPSLLHEFLEPSG